MIIAAQTEKLTTPPPSINLCNMIPTPILLATLASLLTLATAAPVPVAEAATSGRPIKWLTPEGQELCLQVGATQFKPDPADQLYNGALLSM